MLRRKEGGTEKGNQSLSAPPSMRQEQKARPVLRDPRGHPLPRQLFSSRWTGTRWCVFPTRSGLCGAQWKTGINVLLTKGEGEGKHFLSSSCFLNPQGLRWTDTYPSGNPVKSHSKCWAGSLAGLRPHPVTTLWAACTFFKHLKVFRGCSCWPEECRDVSQVQFQSALQAFLKKLFTAIKTFCGY